MQTSKSLASQVLTVGVPAGALIISLFVVYPTWTRCRALQETVRKQRVQLNSLRSAPPPPAEFVLSAAEDEPGEPSRFLGEIATLAAISGCEVVGLDTQASPGSAGKAKSESDGKTAKIIRPVRVKFSVRARYPQVRAFLRRLQEGSRRYAVTEVTLRSTRSSNVQPGTTPSLEAVIGIERYVATPSAGTTYASR